MYFKGESGLSESPLFRLIGVNKTRQGDQGIQRMVLKDINAEVEAVELTTLLGPSGSGKTTLLHLLNRLEAADDGQIFFQNKELRDWDVLALRQQVGLVFQRPVMLSGTVLENIAYGPRLRKMDPVLPPIELLAMVGLDSSYLNRAANRLSGGEQQRVALARTLANGPSVLLLDEVTASLDPTAAMEVERLVLHLKKSLGLTVLWVTHDIPQAHRVSTTVWLLVAGRLRFIADSETFFSGSHPLATRFLSGGMKGSEADE